MIIHRLLVGGVAVLALSGGTAYAQQEQTPPTTVEIEQQGADEAEEDSDNTGLWGLLGLLGLAGLAGLTRRKSTYETRTVPPTGPAAPPTAHGATGVREN